MQETEFKKANKDELRSLFGYLEFCLQQIVKDNELGALEQVFFPQTHNGLPCLCTLHRTIACGCCLHSCVWERSLTVDSRHSHALLVKCWQARSSYLCSEFKLARCAALCNRFKKWVLRASPMGLTPSGSTTNNVLCSNSKPHVVCCATP